MSSISATGGSSLFSLFQNLAAGQTVSTPSTGSATAADSTSSTEDTGGSVQGSSPQALFEQIQKAVTSALQSAQQSGSSSSGSTTDTNSIIENAIAGVLKSDGISAPPGPPPSGFGPNGQSGASASGSTNSTGSTSGNSATQAFFQTLEANGISSQQFRQDFATAIQNAQNGNSNASTAFQSFQPGSLVDTIG